MNLNASAVIARRARRMKTNKHFNCCEAQAEHITGVDEAAPWQRTK
jgi:hypothetical protein